MGTDITIFAERLEGGRWLPVPEPEVEVEPETEVHRRSRKQTKTKTKMKKQSPTLRPVEALNIGRPYGLFTLLAGRPVGLGARLAGSGFPRVFPCRGLPDDMCELYQKTFNPTGKPIVNLDDCWTSWLLLRELEELDWEQPVRDSAFIEARYAALFHPDEPYPRELLPENVKLFHDLFTNPPSGTRKVTWSTPLREYVGCSEWFISSLRALAPDSELRIIYWFSF